MWWRLLSEGFDARITTKTHHIDTQVKYLLNLKQQCKWKNVITHQRITLVLSEASFIKKAKSQHENGIISSPVTLLFFYPPISCFSPLPPPPHPPLIFPLLSPCRPLTGSQLMPLVFSPLPLINFLAHSELVCVPLQCQEVCVCVCRCVCETDN